MIIERNSTAAQSTLHHRTHTQSFEVPYDHLEELVLDKLRDEAIGKLEQASYDQLRKLFFNT